jgi:hypothetical protein
MREGEHCGGELMAIIIKQDGSRHPTVPVNRVNFSQEELAMFGSLGWIVVGNETEMTRENRSATMECARQ